MDLQEIYSNLETVAQNDEELFSLFRTLPVDVVGLILLEVPEEFPNLRQALPKMPSKEVQIKWTGSHGYDLLTKSCAFMRTLELGYIKYTGQQLEGKRLLDYGCGWGRLIRLFYKFSTPQKIYGCDPWKASIDECIEAKLRANLVLCEEIPSKAPFSGLKFDLIFAFSVFTHLSERTAMAVLHSCRESIDDQGLFAITVRPSSYWDLDIPSNHSVDRAKMKADHKEHGFAFTPHATKATGDKVNFGDASISVGYINNNWLEWKIVGVDADLQNFYQTVIFLKPRI
jgi:SAM-dependent methyltransferase